MTDITSPSRRSLILGICLAIPLLALGYSWLTSHREAQQGTYWDVPVGGYDPRDLLRGHYITFQYQWPFPSEDGGAKYRASLCISGTSPQIDKIAQITPSDPINCAKGRFVDHANRSGDFGLDFGRLYVAQTKAMNYESKLNDPKLQGMMRVRVDYNGVLHPVSLSFRTKTAEDLAREEAEGDADERDVLTPIVL